LGEYTCEDRTSKEVRLGTHTHFYPVLMGNG
jgi:hypothetical protein